ncbi:helix-turn-helix transcriptional regulator [Microbispora bryophytorum]|uniref:helix-turn-helix transcriptional regulator n=1 Tax=Microbispora bryophytorum TaxID=1460882 RepID=UPI0033CAFD93
MTTKNGDRRLYPAGELDYPVPPGETLRELLEEQGITRHELAAHTGLPLQYVDQLIDGLVLLRPEVAVALERVTGTPARLWNRLEADYQATQSRRQAAGELWAYPRDGKGSMPLT